MDLDQKSNEIYKLLILYQNKFNTVNMMATSSDPSLMAIAERLYIENKNNLINLINSI